MSEMESELKGAPVAAPELDRLLSVEPSGVMRDTFVGIGRDYGPLRIYGGHLLGQALAAAFATVGDHMLAHSLHAYFLKTGAPESMNGPRGLLLVPTPIRRASSPTRQSSDAREAV